jgi:hypothetical protein
MLGLVHVKVVFDHNDLQLIYSLEMKNVLNHASMVNFL